MDEVAPPAPVSAEHHCAVIGHVVIGSVDHMGLTGSVNWMAAAVPGSVATPSLLYRLCDSH